MKVYLRRRYGFSAAHRLHSTALTDDENRATYGKCNNPHGHGHNYEVEVTVSGAPDETTGQVVHLQWLDSIAEKEILAPFRYRNLNLALPIVPTTENLASEVLTRLRAAWPAESRARLETIRIHETERNICEIANYE